MKLKVVISLSTAPSKQLLAFLYGEDVIIEFIKAFFFLSCSLTPLCTATCQLFLFTQACILSYLRSSGIFLPLRKHFLFVKIRLKLRIKKGKSTGNSLGDIYGRVLSSGKAHTIQHTSKKQAIDSTNQSAFICLLLYDSICSHTALHTAWLQL